MLPATAGRALGSIEIGFVPVSRASLAALGVLLPPSTKARAAVRGPCRFPREPAALSSVRRQLAGTMPLEDRVETRSRVFDACRRWRADMARSIKAPLSASI